MDVCKRYKHHNFHNNGHILIRSFVLMLLSYKFVPPNCKPKLSSQKRVFSFSLSLSLSLSLSRYFCIVPTIHEIIQQKVLMDKQFWCRIIRKYIGRARKILAPICQLNENSLSVCPEMQFLLSILHVNLLMTYIVGFTDLRVYSGWNTSPLDFSGFSGIFLRIWKISLFEPDWTFFSLHRFVIKDRLVKIFSQLYFF